MDTGTIGTSVGSARSGHHLHAGHGGSRCGGIDGAGAAASPFSADSITSTGNSTDPARGGDAAAAASSSSTATTAVDPTSAFAQLGSELQNLLLGAGQGAVTTASAAASAYAAIG